MKVLAINGSPRKNGNTSIIIKAVCEELNKENIETEIISLSDKKIGGCISCYTELPRKPRPLAAGMNWQNNCKNHLANSKYDSILQVRY